MPTHGAWPSPLTAARVTAGALRLVQIQLDGNDVYWLEGRASEGGRYVIVKSSAFAPSALRRDESAFAPSALRPDEAGSSPSGPDRLDITPPGFNVRSRVHEYGGAAYTVHNGAVYFS